MFKVALQPREIPAVETFRLMKCANQAVGMGREWEEVAGGD